MHRFVHLQPFTQDHHTGLAAVGRLLRTLGGDAHPDALADEAVALWERALKPHQCREDALLLPLLQAAAPRAARRMADEHAQLTALVGAIRAGHGDRRVMLASFMAALRAHVRFEERVAFPALERLTDAATLARLDDALQVAEPAE